jgi:uncharacterized protein with WD repeat
MPMIVNTIIALMKSVQYLDAETLSLSRFGVINTGAKLDLYEWEWDDINDDPKFKLLTPTPSKDEVELAAKVKPVATPSFDLRTVPWENPELYKSLSARMSKTVLIKLIRGINEAGGYVEDSSVGENRNALIDKIISAARTMSWGKYTKEERLSFGTAAEQTSSQEQEKVKAARQRVKKSVDTNTNDNDN